MSGGSSSHSQPSPLLRRRSKRQTQPMSGGSSSHSQPSPLLRRRSKRLSLMDKKELCCSVCKLLPDTPVETPCDHNFCLKCFQKWVAQGNETCAYCHTSITKEKATEPKIDYALVLAIRRAKLMKSNDSRGPPEVVQIIPNENQPVKRAKKAGEANAGSKDEIFVTIPHDHFGPILPEHDPKRNQGVLVGETWETREECRKWGVHFPNVAGIAGQAEFGAQSVVLSGHYEDNEDNGDWFIYTGSGGRVLSGQKKREKEASFDQEFVKYNTALRVSCQEGYPVRVVRSYKVKKSPYAPESGVRYDGIYRIEQCWRIAGKKGYLICRFLFVRCDNEPAPWTSDYFGDCPKPLPVIKELKDAIEITQRKEDPAWDFDQENDCWMWKKPPPKSNHLRKVKLKKDFSCLMCRQVLVMPLTTPCAHNFCKTCLEGVFSGQHSMRQRTCEGRRTLRAQKIVMKCPSCKYDISDFVQNPQVNMQLMDVIESMQLETEEKHMELDKEMTEAIIDNMNNLNLDSKDDTCVEDTPESIVKSPEKRVEDRKEKKLKGILKSHATLELNVDGNTLIKKVTFSDPLYQVKLFQKKA